MNYQEYKELLKETVKEVYPKYIREKIINKLIGKGLVIEGKNQLVGQINALNVLDISQFSDEDKLIKCIDAISSVIKEIENHEFNKSYKYSAIFDYCEIDSLEEKINQLLGSGQAIYFTESPSDYDRVVNGTNIPTIYQNDNAVVFKFSVLMNALHPITEKRHMLKYPILAILYSETNVLEIRLDSTKNIFKESQDFYAKRINSVCLWLKSKLGLDIECIDFRQIIEYIIDNNKHEVVINSQLMAMKTGAKAYLDVGANESYTLPLLGELKLLIESNEEEFNNAVKIRELLENFIQEIEETSDLPWVTLLWKKETKAKNIIVKFMHNYMNEKYSLLQHLGEQTNMERMDYVTKYLIENRELSTRE